MTAEPNSTLRQAVRGLLSDPVRVALRQRIRRLRTPPQIARLQTAWSLVPITRDFGFSRGNPIDRYYIEDFVRRHSGASEYAPGAIHGHVLEVGGNRYTGTFGTGVDRVDILDASSENPQATIIADLTDAHTIESDTYDTVICTQTLHFIFDVQAAIQTIHRILKPGGTALVTVPGISQICRPDFDTWGDYWRFTALSARRLFEEAFDPANITVDCYGNVRTATAFLYGLSAEDMSPHDLNLHDPDYQVTIGIKAVKAVGVHGR